MSKAKQWIWVLKPGQPNVDRKWLCQTFGAKGGIYTATSSDAPIWLSYALKVLTDAAHVLEPELANNKTYTLVSFPAAYAKHKSLSFALMKYQSRIIAKYIFDPKDLNLIVAMLMDFNELTEADEQLETALQLHEQLIDEIMGDPAKLQKALQRNRNNLGKIQADIFGTICVILDDALNAAR